MRKILLGLAVLSMGYSAHASNSSIELNTSVISLSNSSYYATNCDEYAKRAADREVSALENFITKGRAYAKSYSYWYGYCQGSVSAGATPLDPVFVAD